MYTLKILLDHIEYSHVKISDDSAIILDIAYDTRKIYHGTTSLFFALINQRDGHDYIREAYEKGVRSFVVSRHDIDFDNYDDANFIWVDNTLKSLQDLAKFHRNQFSYPVIGITGSNGKTIVKEWLFQLLSPDYNCYQSPKSYNSQLGVPLSLWKMSDSFNLAIIEAGISHPGEMSSLADIIRPTVGVFTNVGTAHQEGFISTEQKLLEKWELFNSAQAIVSPSSYLSDEILKDNRVYTWGRESNSFVQIIDVKYRLKDTLFSFIFQGSSFEFLIPFTDKASVENVLTCITVLFQLGYKTDIIAQRISMLEPLEMRLKLKRGKNQTSIIDDSYSNDLGSLQIALDFLNQQNQHQDKKIILSDFEGEEWTLSFEAQLMKILKGSSISDYFFVGPRWQHVVHELVNAYVFNTAQELFSHLLAKPISDATVLVKGARKYKFETICSHLVEQTHETVLEINLKAIEHNIQQYRSKLNPNVKMMAMVKAFSYGSGGYEVANVLQFNKIDYLTVAFVDEGVALRKAGISLPIMVLSPHESTFEDLLSYSLEPEIYSLRILMSFTRFLSENQIKSYPIHIKLDTGMHRLGFMPEEFDQLLDQLLKNEHVKVSSIFSHLVGAGSSDFLSFTQYQIDLFLKYSSKLEDALGYTVIKHICNTSGIIHHPEAHLDMVRLGIGLYGFDMAPKGINLETVSQLKTTITQIKHLGKSETVGYDRKGVLSRDSVIATVKIGYADGYDRRLGNGVGKMKINGSLVPTIGNICMDMCMLDITDIEAREGDEVVIFPNLVQSAKDIGTIPYELLTSISSRVKRVYFYE